MYWNCWLQKDLKEWLVPVALTFSNMEGARRKGVNPCLPLIMALEWTADHPDECEPLSGPKWVQYIFEDLSGAKNTRSRSRVIMARSQISFSRKE
jgi:hypothetical protein